MKRKTMLARMGSKLDEWEKQKTPPPKTGPSWLDRLDARFAAWVAKQPNKPLHQVREELADEMRNGAWIPILALLLFPIVTILDATYRQK